jgi:hypothetical protein
VRRGVGGIATVHDSGAERALRADLAHELDVEFADLGTETVIVSFSELAVELGDVLDAVEANPVIASPDGVIAVDALEIVRSGVGE